MKSKSKHSGIRSPVDPDTAGDEPAAEEEGNEGLDRVGGLRVLLTACLRPPDSAQHSYQILEHREGS